jgi:hypothetical protein
VHISANLCAKFVITCSPLEQLQQPAADSNEIGALYHVVWESLSVQAHAHSHTETGQTSAE